ncbi:transposable element Tcb2 transposase [Trichonephila clavipes]|nr:transposable element Tcb2 transposase [Trichonephila clavipes]
MHKCDARLGVLQQARTATTVSLFTIQRTGNERKGSRQPYPYLPWYLQSFHRAWLSDESCFTIEADDHRLHVWRGQVQWYQSAFVLQRHTSVTTGVTVWDAISCDNKLSLIILHTSLIAQRYVDTILRLVVLPFMARHPGASFHQDNARSHTARISLEYIRAVYTLSWPVRSADLSPIECA